MVDTEESAGTGSTRALAYRLAGEKNGHLLHSVIYFSSVLSHSQTDFCESVVVVVCVRVWMVIPPSPPLPKWVRIFLPRLNSNSQLN